MTGNIRHKFSKLRQQTVTFYTASAALPVSLSATKAISSESASYLSPGFSVDDLAVRIERMVIGRFVPVGHGGGGSSCFFCWTGKRFGSGSKRTNEWRCWPWLRTSKQSTMFRLRQDWSHCQRLYWNKVDFLFEAVSILTGYRKSPCSASLPIDTVNFDGIAVVVALVDSGARSSVIHRILAKKKEK